LDRTDKNGLGVKGSYISYIEKDDKGNKLRIYQIDPKYFCEVVCDAAEKYYINCANKEAFDEHSVKFAS